MPEGITRPAPGYFNQGCTVIGRSVECILSHTKHTRHSFYNQLEIHRQGQAGSMSPAINLTNKEMTAMLSVLCQTCVYENIIFQE